VGTARELTVSAIPSERRLQSAPPTLPRLDAKRPYRSLGAHVLLNEATHAAAGVRFAVWAPHATRASVVGDFNGWSATAHLLQRDHDTGVWWAVVETAHVGQHYKFALHDQHGQALPWKADPYAFAAQKRPDTASRITGLPALAALSEASRAQRQRANRRDAAISIYEVHAGSWRRTPDGSFLSWDELAVELPRYVAGLGFTHIELMPVAEHPLDASWGYQPTGLYAPSARFGNDPAGLQRFVAACHAMGLGVLLDWVPAHFPLDAHGLYRFDGTALYEYGDAREGFHQDWNTAIYNTARWEVRDFLVGNALYWLEHYGLDGLRVDAVASMLYRDYSRRDGQWLPNEHGGRENLEAIALLRELNRRVGAECPQAITLAEESTAFPKVSAPVHDGGLGFHYKWNMGWMNDTLAYMREDPVNRRWHHDKMRFGLVYAFEENFVLPLSHDEVVHGKGSLLGKMPGDDWQRFANLRAYYGFMWGHPGKKLLFMGQEWGQRSEWREDQALPWHEPEQAPHAGTRAWVGALNTLLREHPALHRRDADPSGFEWLVHDDADNSVFAWLRHDGQGGQVLVVCNFTPVPRHGYVLGLPAHAATQWAERLNSDDAGFGGSGVGQAGSIVSAQDNHQHGRSRSISLTLPPLSTVFFTPT
jgi:1,4-alpha-glucan branching enzyme